MIHEQCVPASQGDARRDSIQQSGNAYQKHWVHNKIPRPRLLSFKKHNVSIRRNIPIKAPAPQSQNTRFRALLRLKGSSPQLLPQEKLSPHIRTGCAISTLPAEICHCAERSVGSTNPQSQPTSINVAQ